MQIPPLKKSTFYVVVAVVLLAGIIIGSLLTSYVIFKNRDRICILSQPPKINTNLSQQQIANATSLQTNKIMTGKVVSKESSQFSIETTVLNPLDSKKSVTATVKIPFDPQKDSVTMIKQIATSQTSSTIKEISASFADIKVGEQILVKVLQDKKMVYIPSPQ